MVRNRWQQLLSRARIWIQPFNSGFSSLSSSYTYTEYVYVAVIIREKAIISLCKHEVYYFIYSVYDSICSQTFYYYSVHSNSPSNIKPEIPLLFRNKYQRENDDASVTIITEHLKHTSSFLPLILDQWLIDVKPSPSVILMRVTRWWQDGYHSAFSHIYTQGRLKKRRTACASCVCPFHQESKNMLSIFSSLELTISCQCVTWASPPTRETWQMCS